MLNGNIHVFPLIVFVRKMRRKEKIEFEGVEEKSSEEEEEKEEEYFNLVFFS